MTDRPLFDCENYFVQAFEKAQACYGHLALDYVCYINHLYPIITKYLGEYPRRLLVINFLKELHTDDLYLTIACAEKGEVAWQQFDKRFGAYLFDLAKRESVNVDAARELAASVFTDLFFDDRAKRPRIASYEGQCPLTRWLRIVMANRASDERTRKGYRLDRLDDTPNLADENSLQKIELPLRANQYRPLVHATFRGASSSLNEQEKYLLLMCYDQKLKEKEIARTLGVHPSTVTRQLQRIYQKLKQEMMTILTQRYHLNEVAIEECVDDMLENSEHSLLEFIKYP